MPGRLLVHPNERLDKEDFDYAASGYAEALQALNNKSTLLSRRSMSLNGFRIELADQVARPGEITIHNGSYVDSTGRFVTNEESVTSSQTITLLGTNQWFFVELSFEEADGTPDDRAFWDPTFDNGTGNIKGKEYVQEINTRTSLIWSVSQPVSTTGFSVTADPTSSNVPLAILKTDALGRITVSANAGLAVGPFSTTLEEYAGNGSLKLKVFDATLIGNVGSDIVIGAETREVADVDRVAGIITLTTSTGVNHNAGTIIYNVGGPNFINQRTVSAVDENGGTTTHPDKLRRLFMGDETRGAALWSSAYAAGARNDLQIQSLKDEVDALAAQIREMKLGGVVNDTTANYSAARYYDFVGSIQGSKQAHYTIGNGTTTWGDFNGTDHTPFQAAHDAAVARGFGDVVMSVKPGTYSFTSTVTNSIPIKLVCETASFDVLISADPVPAFTASTHIEFVKIQAYLEIGLVNCAYPFVNVTMRDCDLTCWLDTTYVVQGTNTVNAKIYNSQIGGSGIWLKSPTVNCTMYDSTINTDGTFIDITGNSILTINNNRFNITGNGTSTASTIVNLQNSGSVGVLNDSDFSGNVIKFTDPTATIGCIFKGLGTINRSTVRGNKISYTRFANSCKVMEFYTVTKTSFSTNEFNFTMAVGNSGTGSVFLQARNFQESSVLDNIGGDTNSVDLTNATNTAGYFVNIHMETCRHSVFTGNKTFGFLIPIRLDDLDLGRTTNVIIANNVLRATQSYGIWVNAIQLQHCNVIGNIIDDAEGGGIVVNGNNGFNVKVDKNTIYQDSGATGVDSPAIIISNLTNVSTNGNDIEGTSGAATGAAVTRASVQVNECSFWTCVGNRLFWNPLHNSGTTDQAQIYWGNVRHSMVTGNVAYGYDGIGTNRLINGNRSGTTDACVVGYMSNMIIGDPGENTTQGAYSGGASPAAQSLMTDSNIIILEN